jgi:hypothetical protein
MRRVVDEILQNKTIDIAPVPPKGGSGKWLKFLKNNKSKKVES